MNENPYDSPEADLPAPKPAQVTKGTRFCSALLMVGGVSWAATVVFIWWVSSKSALATLLAVVAVVICAAFVYVGFHLWRGQEWATKAAIFMFALQVPVVISSTAIYMIIGGLGFVLSVNGAGVLNFNFFFGGQFQFHLGPEVPTWTAGINFIALACMIYLRKPRSTDQGLYEQVAQEIREHESNG